MVKPIPDNVKNCLSQLSAAQQVTLRGYIGSLRAEINSLEEEIRTANDPDPHAHFHGHEKCTADHGHDNSHGKAEEHDHALGKHDHHEDSHEHKKDHDHHGHHEHSHGHGDKCTEDHGNDHDKHGQEHDHVHAAPPAGDLPAWKKRALEAGNDPTAAPFGGSWNMESSLSASDGVANKMEE